MNEDEKVERHLSRRGEPNRGLQLLLVGDGSHYHQYVGGAGGDGAPDQFTAFLREICAAYKPDLLAEELSEQMVIESADDSTLRVLAKSLALPHLFCDPNDAERKALNIPDYTSVLVRRFDGDRERTDDYMKQFWPVREREWMRRVAETQTRRCLLVVGAKHVKTLPIRAAELHIAHSVLCERWLPSR
jgi:hypothetical protein